MEDEWFYVITVVVGMAVLYMGYQVYMGTLHEGFETDVKSTTKSGMGEASSGYVASLKSKVIQMKDRLLVEKYKADYEEVLLHLDEYVDQLSLQEALQFDANSSVAALAALGQAKVALNNAMKYLDS